MDNKQKGQCTVIAITYPDTFLEQSGSHAMLTLASVRPHSRSLLVNTPLLWFRTCVLIQPEPPVGSLNQATEWNKKKWWILKEYLLKREGKKCNLTLQRKIRWFLRKTWTVREKGTFLNYVVFDGQVRTGTSPAREADCSPVFRAFCAETTARPHRKSSFYI